MGAKVIYYLLKKYSSIVPSKTETEFGDTLIEALGPPMLFAGFIAGLLAGYLPRKKQLRTCSAA